MKSPQPGSQSFKHNPTKQTRLNPKSPKIVSTSGSVDLHYSTTLMTTNTSASQVSFSKGLAN